MNGAPRLIAFDLDGTVLDHGVMSARTVRALETAHGHGCINVVSTGRSIHMLPSGLTDAPWVDYLITSNGAQVTDRRSRSALFYRPVDRLTALAVINDCEPFARAFSVQFADAVVFERRSMFMMLTGPGAMERRRPGMLREYLSQVTLVRSAKREIMRSPERVIEKVVAVCRHTEDVGSVVSRVSERFGVEAAAASEHDAEITAAGVTKGSALTLLLASLGIEKSACAAFGDSGNDLSLGSAAGIFIAMGNAAPEVKAAADAVARPVSEDGVARIVEGYEWN